MTYKKVRLLLRTNIAIILYVRSLKVSIGGLCEWRSAVVDKKGQHSSVGRFKSTVILRGGVTSRPTCKLHNNSSFSTS